MVAANNGYQRRCEITGGRDVRAGHRRGIRREFADRKE